MRRPPASRLILLAVAAGAVLLSGCSSSGSDGVTTADRSTTTGLVRPSTTSTAPPLTNAPPLTGTTQPSGPPDGSGLTFRPVLSVQPCSSVTPPGDAPLSTETTVPAPGQADLLPAEDGVLCYALGPAGATGEDLARAAADIVPQTGAWTVLVTPKPEAEAEFNRLFDACFAGAPTCPAGAGSGGSVAIVLDGSVLSAPSISAEGLASSPFQISAAFTERDAQALAARLNG